MIDFTDIQMDRIQDIVREARKSNKITYQKVSDDLGLKDRSYAKYRENSLTNGSAEGFISFIKAIGGVLYFEPDASKTDVPYLLRVIEEYKSGVIDASTAGRKIVHRLSSSLEKPTT